MSTNNIELTDESLAILLNAIYKQIQEDRSITRDQFERLAAQIPENISPSSTFIAAELAKGIAGYLAEFTDSTEKMLKLAKILSDKLAKTEVNGEILADSEKINAQDLISEMIEARKDRADLAQSSIIPRLSIADQLDSLQDPVHIPSTGGKVVKAIKVKTKVA